MTDLATVCPECGELEFGPHCEAERWKVMQQDERNGAAIRRLEEAPGWGADTIKVIIDLQDDDFPVTVWVHGYTSASGRGITIAEAADKCREALTKEPA